MQSRLKTVPEAAGAQPFGAILADLSALENQEKPA
jgi:hypothetical protein